jgi:hypothetical protein
MHHGEFEVRRGIIDRDASVFGDRHHYERKQREGERHAQPHRRRTHEFRYGGELSGAGN